MTERKKGCNAVNRVLEIYKKRLAEFEDEMKALNVEVHVSAIIGEKPSKGDIHG